MRKLIHLQPDGPVPFSPVIFLSPSPAPAEYPPLYIEGFINHGHSLIASIPIPKIGFDLATLSVIVVLLFLSLSAAALIFYLYEKSRCLHHLQNFNSLWIVRLLLVFLASFWSVNEISRLPYVRRKYLYMFLPPMSLEQEANICKLHIVLSLGFLQPGFLITLLFLINVSIKKKSRHCICAILSILTLCVPTIFLQIFFIYFSPFENILPKFLYISSVITTDASGNKNILCTCSFFSWLIYSGFSITYAVVFSFTCWRVVKFAINKGIGRRINILSTTVMVSLPLHVVCLSMSWMWMPENNVYGCLVFFMFLCVASCMAVALVLLVHKPIKDALEAGGDCSWWDPNGCLPPRPAEERGGGRDLQR